MSRQRLFQFLGLIFLLLPSGPALAANPYLHYFDCKECHLANLTVTQMSAEHVCLKCHQGGPGGSGGTAANNKSVPPPAEATDPDPLFGEAPGKINWRTEALFSVGDASNAFSNNAEADQQTSHHWAAPSVRASAGAKEPKTLYAGFYSRYGASKNKVTCSRCHNPHGEAVLGDPASPDNPLANPKLLVRDAQNDNRPMEPEAMCRACHETWANVNDHGWLSHPMIGDYAATAGSKPGYKSAQAIRDAAAQAKLDGRSAIDLINFEGATGIGCLSCHGVHNVDSAAGTADGVGRSLSTGDGKLLRGDGASRADKSALCQSCHTYQAHGDASGAQAGCLVCHSGHSYDPTLPNYFILRKSATKPDGTVVSGLDYSSPGVLATGSKYTYWNDRTDGTANGYCEKCHGDAKTIGAGAGKYHVTSAICTDCHSHGQAAGAFAASCNACHGMPPVVNLPRPGDGLVTIPASTGSPSVGQHGKHAVEYSYSCATCHFNGMPSTPVSGNNALQIGFSSIATGTGTIYHGRSAMASPYVYQGTNGTAIINDSALTCSNTYCHSNGTSVATGTIPANTSATWDSGALDCSSCHGSPPTYASGTPKANSHAAHQDYTCDKCHSSTTTTGTTITGNANHVNQAYNVSAGSGVSFTYTYAASGGTCSSISCHNSGSGTWGTNTPCSSCHSDIKSLHIATPETGRVAMHQGGSFSVNCTSCHSLSLLALHANDCDLCHESTAASVSSAIAAWNGTCGACHESNHAAANSKAAIGHAPYGYDKCTDLCHANGYAYASKTEKAHISNCFICHVSSTGPNPSAPPTWARASNGKLLLVQTYEGKQASDQQFVTPTGVTALTIDAYGATGSEGGDRAYSWIPNAGAGGLGGRVQAELPVTPLQVLTLRVGLSGGRYQDYTNTWRSPAGWPNGGSGADPTSSTGGGSGGGSTSVLSDSTVLIEAGGGAGGAYVPYGGNADGKVGGAGGAVADSGPGGNQTGGSGTSFGGGGGGGGWTGGAGGAAGLGGNGGASYLGLLVGTITPGVKYADLPGYLPKSEIITRNGLLNISWSDEIVPATTSDAAASYSGAGGTITLTASDSGGAGVAATRYRLDGREEVTGTSVNVPETTVDVVHTLAFYSIDNAGNTDAENVVTFTVFGDPLAPVTTSDVKMTRYWGEAIISLTATDPGGSGVASTHFRLDGGAESSGSTVIVAPPATGMETHSLEFWSVDRTGNIEASHLVTFEISPTDNMPPTTTSDAMSSYPLSATINLSASDDVSGVASTRYRLDAGVESAGTMVFTSLKGEHSLEYWSVDHAGNIETHKTVTFGVGVSWSTTYNYTGTEQFFTVPAGVTAIIVDLYGAQGGQGGQGAGLGAVGGLGGKVHAQIPVTPGTKLTVVVGGQGWPYGPNNNKRGYQNGLGTTIYYGGGGGGSSFISLGSVTNYGDDTSGLVLAEAGAGSGGNGTTQGLPGGNQGAGVRHQWHGDWLSPGHGGGWNHGETVGTVSGGGTSFIATGTGTLTTGVRQGNGEVTITWYE